MHIPDGLLSIPIIITLWIISILVIILGFLKMGKVFENEDSDKLIPYIGVLGAVIFAFQFVNFPVPGGSSGHLVGGTVVGVILGPWASVILILMVLIVQSLFGDGGIFSLGANTFNMGVIGGVLGFYIVKIFVMILNKTKIGKELKVTLATAIGAYISIVLAAIIAGIEIGLSGIIPIEISVPIMTYWHLLIGIGEAVISALIILFIYKVKPSLISTETMLGVK